MNNKFIRILLYLIISILSYSNFTTNSIADNLKDGIEIYKSGKMNGKIIVSGDTITIILDGKKYIGVFKGEKRKYSDESGKVINEIKFKDEGFKLRTDKGDLIWKIKYDESKIKISDNEENKNPFSINLKSEENAKLKKEDKEIGKIIFNKEKKNIEVTSDKDSYSIRSDNLNLAYGVLVFYNITELHRYMIAAELLQKKWR